MYSQDEILGALREYYNEGNTTYAGLAEQIGVTPRGVYLWVNTPPPKIHPKSLVAIRTFLEKIGRLPISGDGSAMVLTLGEIALINSWRQLPADYRDIIASQIDIMVERAKNDKGKNRSADGFTHSDIHKKHG